MSQQYRILYKNRKVESYIEDDGTSITYPANDSKAIQGTIEDAIDALVGKGVNFSSFWKDSLMSRFIPQNGEVPISNHPLESSILRRVFIHSMPINQQEKFFWLNCIVRHFNTSNDHIISPYDDEMFSIKTDNSVLINGIGEYDYFKSLIDSGANMFQLQLAQIPIMDGLGRFGENIYQ